MSEVKLPGSPKGIYNISEKDRKRMMKINFLIMSQDKESRKLHNRFSGTKFLKTTVERLVKNARPV